MASFSAGLNTGIDNVEERLPPLENLSIANESLINQVASAKQELKHHFQRYQRMLNDKHQQMVSQLDAILLSANDLYKKKKELIQAQGELEEKFKSNEFHDMKIKMMDLLLVEMSELERSISRSEREVVELAWKDSQLEAAIKESCVVLQRVDTVVDNNSIQVQDVENEGTKESVSKPIQRKKRPPPIPRKTPYKRLQNAVSSPVGISYRDRQVPVWSVGSAGSGDGQMKEAKGLAIDPENEDIYIADRDNNRIVVFSRGGEFLRNMTVQDLNKPDKVLIRDEYCFVACDLLKEGLIMKMDKKTGLKLAEFKPGCNVIALTYDTETEMLFSCPVNAATIWYIQQQDLMKVCEVKLHTMNYTQGASQIHDLETRKEEIFVLFCNSPSPLQSFSRDGKLLRNMIIPAYMIHFALFFTIDSQDNFIFSDSFGHKVKIFSHTGELIAAIGKVVTGERARGELYSPRGIALTRNGNIVVCDGKKKNRLQMFLAPLLDQPEKLLVRKINSKN